MKTNNISLTENNIHDPKMDIHTSIIESSHNVYIKDMLATVHPQNVKQVYKGFQSFPSMDDHGQLEVRMWNNYGVFHTPHYGETFDINHYKDDQSYKAEIVFPEDIADQQAGRQWVSGHTAGDIHQGVGGLARVC